MSAIPPNRLRDPVLVFALSCALALGWLLVGLVSVDTIEQVFAESGPIESASALFLILGALALTGDMLRRKEPGRWHLAVLALAAGLRELDWDKGFTDSGILSLRLYSGAAPVAQKIAGALVVALLVWAGLRLLRRNLGPWLSGLRGGQVWAWLMACALSLYALAKTLDGLGRKLAGWGIELSEWANRTAGRVEEGMELFGAILIVQVVGLSLSRPWLQHRARPQPATFSRAGFRG
ncbi:MAG: hypothetical protein ACK41U_11930 [Paracoccus sp. (in: a-proteobacteria)]|uniref:hypothetical protein n=1 Tax=Paracoccus sp. TaxID=267 RepID=UPI0039198394